MIDWAEKGKTSLVAPEGVVRPMPLNGDKECLGVSSSPVVQNEVQPPKSSPRGSSKSSSASYAQGWGGHKSGNPKHATKISIPGTHKPINNLNAASNVRHHQQEKSYGKKRHQGNGSLKFAGQPRRQDRNDRLGSEPDTPIVGQLERSDYRVNRPNTESPIRSDKAIKGRQGHPELSPLPFTPAAQDVYELPQLSPDDLEVNGHSAMREKKGSKPVASKKPASSAAREGDAWKLPSDTDPTRTTFTSKNKPSSLSSTAPSYERPPKSRSPKSDTSIRLSVAWRGAIYISGFETLLRRNGYETITVYSKSEEVPGLSIKLENIQSATYTDDETNRNWVHIKLRNHEHKLASAAMFMFEGRSELEMEDPRKRDAMRFIGWLEKGDVECQKKPGSVLGNRLQDQEDLKNSATHHNSKDDASLSKTIVPQKLISKAALSELGLYDHPRQTRSRPPGTARELIDLKKKDTAGGSALEMYTADTHPRRSLRNQPKPEPLPKPEPHPVQTWSESLKFPFQKRGPCDILDSTSLRLLDPDQFLNDEVINFHLAIIRERLQRDNPAFAAKVHIFNTYLYDAYSGSSGDGKTSNYSKVQRWTKDVDIFEKDFIFIPVNEKYHWFLAVVCNLPAAMAKAQARAKAKAKAEAEAQRKDNEKEDELVCTEPSSHQKPVPTPKRGGRNPVPADSCAVIILDSMNGVHNTTLRGVKQYLKAEGADKKDAMLELEDLMSIAPRKIPGQDNFSDCGIFMLHYIEKMLENPSQIKETLYEKDFGSDEASRKLWKISEVVDKRDRMWRLFVRLKEEYDKFLRKEPFDEFPDIEGWQPPAKEPATKPGMDGAADDLVIIDDEAKPAVKSKDATKPLDVQRVASPAKRKSESHEEDNLPAKRTKSISPRAASPAKRKSDDQDEINLPAKRPKSISPSGAIKVPNRTNSESLDDVIELPTAVQTSPRAREKSIEIPYGGDEIAISEDSPNEEAAMQMDALELMSSGVPLVAACGLPVPPSDIPESMGEHLELDAEEPPRRIPPGLINHINHEPTPQTQANGVNTPTLATTHSFSDLSIIGKSETPAELGLADSIVDDKDTPMPDAPNLVSVEDIDDDDDSLVPSQPLQYGGASRGKSVHELANDRIVDSPSSSQDRRSREKTPPPRKRGDAIHNPIILDSQSSPKRSGLRSSQAAAGSAKA